MREPHFEYDSDRSEDASWRQAEGSVDELKNINPLGLDEQNIAVPHVYQLRANITETNAPSVDRESLEKEIEKVSASMRDQKLNKNTRTFDSLYALRSRLESFNLQQELLGARHIYSDKYIQRLHDSLGVKKADSIFRVAQKYAKTEIPREDLLNRLNNDILYN